MLRAKCVEYGAKWRPGWVSCGPGYHGIALVAVLCYELIRLYHVYDYKSTCGAIGSSVLGLRPGLCGIHGHHLVMSSATGAVVRQMFGVSTGSVW